METQDRDAVIAVALMAALADGNATDQEKAELRTAIASAGATDLDRLTAQITTGQLRLQDLAARLPAESSRREAYELALLVCNSDGPANAAEGGFLASLRSAFGLTDAAVAPAAPPVASGTPPSPASTR